MILLLLDEGSKHRFLLTGSSARKLKKRHVDLLPGRILIEHLGSFLFWELEGKFELEKALLSGTFPGVYLEETQTASEILQSYGQIYLQEEIQAEALTRNLGSYGRLLDLSAEASGQWINYSKISSDSEILKETLRRFYSLLEDTLVAFRCEFIKARSVR